MFHPNAVANHISGNTAQHWESIEQAEREGCISRTFRRTIQQRL